MKIAERKPFFSDVIKVEFDGLNNYMRELATLNITDYEDMVIGQVFDLDTGNLLADATVGAAAKIGILIDDDAYYLVTADGSYKLAVFTGGPAGSGHGSVSARGLVFADTLSQANLDAVYALLESQGMAVLDKVL